MVRCPNCQHESTGRFFCDRCHQLLPVTIQPPVPDSVTLPDGHVVDCSWWHGVWPADGWTARVETWGESPCRVYALNRTWWRDLSAVVARRASVALDILAPLAVVPVGEAAIVVARRLPAARPALMDLDPPGADLFIRLDGVLAACRLLARALEPLHAAGFVWLDFDPAGIDVAGDRVMVRSLDLRLFPAGEVPANVRPLPGYASPEERDFHDEGIGPATDVFHVSLFAYYRLAGLFPSGFPGNGPQTFDFKLPELRIYCPDLPPGIARVLQRGLMPRPADRFTSVAEMRDSLEEAIGSARRRQNSRTPIRIESAGGSRIGAMHEQMGMPNQDVWSIVSPVPGDLEEQFTNSLPGEHSVSPTRQRGRFDSSLANEHLVAIVADGVSHALVGSGDRASRITLDRLTMRLPELLGSAGSLRDLLTVVFFETSQAILAEALADPAAVGEIDPIHVMSSTALVGLVRGNELTLAAVGDSRAYLIADGIAEQLTVDGDVRCVELARGLPPEQIRLAGEEAFALYTCLGVGEREPGGPIVASRERSRPSVTRWTLLPGDIVILCTDGLAEEGLFLSPADLARIVAESRERSPAELVETLIDAANDCRRPPSPEEPYGCGDDITCVVLVVR